MPKDLNKMKSAEKIGKIMRKGVLLGVVILILLGSIVFAETETLTGSFTVGNAAPSITYPTGTVTVSRGNLVNITPVVVDPNGDDVIYNFSSPLNNSGLWQTTSSDGGVYTVTLNVTDGVFNVSEIFTLVISPYCGDGTCNSGDGESCANCVSDCGVCPTGTGGGSGGGGGGGVSRQVVQELESEVERLENLTKNATILPGGSYKKVTNFEAEIQELYFELQEDEFVGRSVDLFNYLSDPLLLTARVEGDLDKSILLDTSYLTIQPKSNETLDILILGNKPPGEYMGDLILESAEGKETIPITLKIIKRITKPELESLDMDIDLITPIVIPGETLKFKLSIRKTPLVLEEAQKILLKYLVLGLNTENMDFVTGAVSADFKNLSQQRKDMIYSEEQTMIEDILYLPKEVKIPIDFPTGEYILTVNADFKGKKIPLFIKFNVKTPWYEQEFLNMKKGVFLILIVILSVLWVVFLLSRVSDYQRRRYSVVIDKGSLPKEGARSAYVGMIAERSRKAYIPLDDLKTHILISGSTGCGKTTAASVIAEEAIDKGVSVVVFDPTAQWTGFLNKADSKGMLKRYKHFGMDNKEAKQFGGKIYSITNPKKSVDINKLVQDKLSIVLLDKMDAKGLNSVIANTIKKIFKDRPKEHRKLETLLIFDEVHRLLPRFGGSKQGYTQLERAVRECRKWGIGIVLISQVTEDLVGPIEANVATQIQMKTNDKTDLNRVESKYGKDLLRSVFKSPTGIGLLSNSSYHQGKPYFIEFRPILHSLKGLDSEEIEKHLKYGEMINRLKNRLGKLEGRKVNVLDLQIELELAEKQVNLGKFDLADIYIKSLNKKVKKNLKKKKEKIKEKKKEIKKKKENIEEHKTEEQDGLHSLLKDITSSVIGVEKDDKEIKEESNKKSRKRSRRKSEIKEEDDGRKELKESVEFGVVDWLKDMAEGVIGNNEDDKVKTDKEDQLENKEEDKNE